MAYIGNEPVISAVRTITEIVATNSQSTFTANGGYTVGYLDVFVNGAQLTASDFTATNGTTVVLNDACVTGDIVRLVAWGTFNTGNINGSSIVDASITQAKLATGVAGTGPAFKARPTTTQSVTSATYTKVTLGTEDWDTNNNFASSRFTPTVAGYYSINGVLYSSFSSSASYIWILIYKNGVAEVSGNLNVPVTTIDGVGVVNGLVYLNGSTDYVELYCYLAGTSPTISNAYTQFSGFLARAA